MIVYVLCVSENLLLQAVDANGRNVNADPRQFYLVLYGPVPSFRDRVLLYKDRREGQWKLVLVKVYFKQTVLSGGLRSSAVAPTTAGLYSLRVAAQTCGYAKQCMVNGPIEHEKQGTCSLLLRQCNWGLCAAGTYRCLWE